MKFIGYYGCSNESNIIALEASSKEKANNFVYECACECYDGYYHSGIYSGQFRPAVYLQRRLPIYRQYYTMSTLNKNNKAYHIGDNTLGFFGADPKEIAESIRGVELDN